MANTPDNRLAFYPPIPGETNTIEHILHQVSKGNALECNFNVFGVIELGREKLWAPALLGIEHTNQDRLELNSRYLLPFKYRVLGCLDVDISTDTLRIVNQQASGLRTVGRQSGYLVGHYSPDIKMDQILCEAEKGTKPSNLDEGPYFRITDRKYRGRDVMLLVFPPSRWASRLGLRKEVISENWIVLDPETKMIVPSECNHPLSAERWDPQSLFTDQQKTPVSNNLDLSDLTQMFRVVL